MTRLHGAVVLALLAGCSNEYDFRSNEYSDYYRKPGEETESRVLERKQIVTWVDVKNKQRIGYLERHEMRLKGARDFREFYAILNRAGTERIGMITAEGRLYRFDENGRTVYIGEYPIVDTGLKVFFNVPLRPQGTDARAYLVLEDIDPYGDF